ncbi:hypothetical protein GCM10027277_25320 [Pseudoduganella ginsengisoli]|uniref:DUF4400 domain-containing protein n=1 Tax=Pseudoduganella ginsengisoli TaxID=1462440 RepID=A0A6L6Q012_9BURK|nr:DUF4400 domain-containing protein [Pseudoduganella ginsengisoli]MTW02744.1 DUF4400 domain-containing protein [Pseudoduganella ginsengisoli]
MTMIRAVTIASLVGLLLLVLYLPAVAPPSAFFGRIRAEHGQQGAAWGQAHARQALERALSIAERPVAAPMIGTDTGAGKGMAMTAAGRQFDTVGRRLLDSDYLRSVNALLLLAAFRLAALVQLAPGFLLLACACVADGLVRRRVKSLEFSRHHPEVWTASVCAGCLAVCTVVITAVLPAAVPVVLAPLMVGSACVCTAIAIANYPAGTDRGITLV